MPRLIIFTILSALLVLAGHPAFAQTETSFKITVRAEDARFVGTAMGGARIIVTDRRTGDVLAQGTTHGDAAGTDALMGKQAVRHAVLAGEDTASLEFSLELVEPLPVTISATAPLAQPQSLVTTTKDMLLLPGKDYTQGNGILLELAGIVVDIVNPPAQTRKKLETGKPVNLLANVLKLSGDQVAKDTPWPPEQYMVEAHVYQEAYYLDTLPMTYAGQPGIFTANLKIPKAGTYRIDVTAFDPATKEAGMDSTSIIITAE